MAKLSAHGTEIARYFSTKHGGLVSVCADGVSLIRRPDTSWQVLSRKKAEVSLDKWTANKLQFVAGLAAWKLQVSSLPSMDTIAEWMADSVCETVTGELVEPDGVGSDGAPSWLLALGLI